jgi:hypothetical protein
MSQAQHLEEKKWQYACRLFRTNSLKEGALWHVDPLLGNGSVNSGHCWVMAATHAHNNRRTFGSGVVCVVCAEAI